MANLNRNVRPLAQGDDDEEESFHTDSEYLSPAANSHLADSDGELSESNTDTSSMEEAEAVEDKLNAVSFGALKKANENISRKRKADDEHGPDQEAKLESLKKRLQLIKDEKLKSNTKKQSRSTHRTIDVQPSEDEDNDDSDDTTSSEPDEQTTKGRAKHAPAAQSSKYQVSRKRQVVDVRKTTARDPRFDAVRQAPTINDHREKAYSFLHDYQKSEMQELKATLKTTKSQSDKETLRRKLNAMENRIKAREAKDRERDIIRKHRKEESTQVQQGKNPYYLKRNEVKQRALVEKYDGMKSKEREKLIERRKKKDSQKEKRRMPELRRVGT